MGEEGSNSVLRELIRDFFKWLSDWRRMAVIAVVLGIGLGWFTIADLSELLRNLFHAVEARLK